MDSEDPQPVSSMRAYNLNLISAKPNLSCVRLMNPGNHFDDGRFARAVFADERNSTAA